MGRNNDYVPESFLGILSQYDITPVRVEAYKLIYRVEAREGIFALKEVKYPENEFCFIYAALEHLASHGFSYVNRVLPVKNYYPYAEYQGKRYALSKWIQGREADYSRRNDVKIAAQTLANLHKSSKGFTPPPYEGRIKWGTWPDSMQGKMKELMDFKKQVMKKNQKTLFDRVFLAYVDYYIHECEKALEMLNKGGYEKVNGKEAQEQFFCHHDYAPHNVIIDENGTGHVIDFDYCISDIRCHDVGSLMLRVMKRSNWDYRQAVQALNYYDRVRRVSSRETKVINALLRFPQDFWQVAFCALY